MNVSLLRACTVLALLGCTTADSERAPNPARRPSRPISFEEMKPRSSAGPQPAGTRQDPFVGEAVIMGIAHPRNKPPQLLVKHREIPHFMGAMQMTVFVAPNLIEGVSEGDVVRLYFARTGDVPHGFTAAQMWFGHELFRVEKLPDSSASATSGKAEEHSHP